MESQMSSLHSSHVLLVPVHYLDQLYKTPLGETPRYKIHVSTCITMQCITPLYILCSILGIITNKVGVLVLNQEMNDA